MNLRICRFALGMVPVALLAACGPDQPDEDVPTERHAVAGLVRQAAPLRGDPRDTLRMERTLGDSMDFARITFVRPTASGLLIADELSSPHLSLMDPATGRIVQRFGRHGKGPREFTSPQWAYSDASAGGRVWLYDYANTRFSLLDPGAAQPVVREQTLQPSAALLSPVWVGDSLLSNAVWSAHTLAKLDGRGRPGRWISVEPPASRRTEAGVRDAGQVNRNRLALHPDGGVLALAYQYESRVDVFDTNGALRHSLAGPRPVRPRFTISTSGGVRRPRRDPSSEMAYVAVDASRRHVYALFCGSCGGSDALPTRVHVFTWDGDFAGELALDRPVKTLAVSPGGDVLYGVMDEPYPAVGVWPLPARLRGR